MSLLLANTVSLPEENIMYILTTGLQMRKKLRLLSVLKLKIDNVDIDLSDFTIDWAQYEADTVLHYPLIPVTITEEDIPACKECISVITYIAGYFSTQQI